MKMNTPELRQSGGEVEFVDSQNDFAGYANVNLMSIGSEEAMIRFGRRNPSAPEQASTVAIIYLSLVHFKRMSIALTTLVGQYEEIFGEIVIDEVSNLSDKGKQLLEQTKANESSNRETSSPE